MHERFEPDEKWLREVTDCLYWSLMYDWDIPKRIRDHYGLTEDYRLYHQLSAMKNTGRKGCLERFRMYWK